MSEPTYSEPWQQETVKCSECGGAVCDEEVHTRWHDRLNRALRLASISAAVEDLDRVYRPHPGRIPGPGTL